MSEKQRRNGHRLVANQLIKDIMTLLSADTLEVTRLRAQIVGLKKQNEKIDVLNEAIQISLDDDDLIFEDMESAQIEETKIRECIISAEDKLSSLSSSSSGVSTANRSTSSVVKLPTLNLRKFGGKPLEWPQFWDQFKGSVHSRTDLTDAQKYGYLIGQLEGVALRTLEGLTITDAHYKEAVALLERTYGKPNIIVQAHLHAILDLECVKATSSELGKFRASYECNLRGLRTMKMKVEEAGYVFVTILLRKLPAKVRENINRAHQSDIWTLDTFCKAIDKEIEFLLANEPDDPIENKETFKSAQSVKIKNIDSAKLKSTAGSFGITAPYSVKFNNKKCKFCYGEHKSDQCYKHKTVSERVARVKELRLCFNCLGDNHPAYNCHWKTRCTICKRKHHVLICPEDKESIKPIESKDDVKISATTVSAVTVSCLKTKFESVALPTAIMPIKSGNRIVSIRAFFDQGSQLSFIVQSDVDYLNLKSKGQRYLTIDGFESEGKKKIYDLVDFVVNAENCITVEAVVVKNLPSRIGVAGISKLAKQLTSRGIELADSSLKEDLISNVGILIGADQYYRFVYGMTAFGDVHLMSSCLGMMITGPIHSEEESRTSIGEVASVLKIGFTEIQRIDEEINKIWSQDALGIKESESSIGEDNVLIEFKKSIRHNDGSYTVKLPWKTENPILKSNYGLACGRLKATLSRLKRNDDHLQAYNKIIKDYKEKGFIEAVTTKMLQCNKERVHYLSHHGVLRPSATTPLRIVFDCSAGRPSLNDNLHSGPCLLNEMCRVILRFRVGRYALVSDISKAFLMINLAEEDRNATLFMWPTNPWNEDSELCTYRFRVVLFGATCSPFLLNATIQHHLSMNKSPIASSIQRNIYVDNLQCTAGHESELISFYEESKRLLGKANLTLREWATNSPELKKKIEIQRDGRASNDTNPKLLGMEWRTEDDFLFCNGLTPSISKEEFTKRNILSCVSKIFDPLGLLTPVTIKAKIFMQKLWRKKHAWDEVIPEEDYNEFSKIIEDLQLIVNVGVPRRISRGKAVDLHAFSDASSKAYGSIIYAISDERSSLVMAKGRVAPLKDLSIPKLELSGALMSTRLVNYILETYSEELQILSVTYWTDSKVVLSWIASEKSLNTFERNRVNEIRKNSSSDQWRYVNTKENPADILSRGIVATKLVASELWFHGPQWLTSKQQWPKSSEFDVSNYEIPYENVSKVAVVTGVPCGEAIIEPRRYSSLKSMLRITALVKKFIKLVRQKKEEREESSLNVADIEDAMNYWFKKMQEECYSAEIKYLQKPKGSPPSIVRQLGLFYKDGLLRCRGRIEHSAIHWNSKYPILLPPKHPITILFIRDAHRRVYHFGSSAVVEFLRRKFWIPRIRQNVKMILRSCVICKRNQGRPYKDPPFPPLPKFRTEESKPFSTTGVDYTGALFVKVKEEIEKAYIVLFTCAVTRAVHLEVVKDNSRDTFIRAFRRFVSRRSCPRYLISDNARTFSSSDKFLKKLQMDPKVKDELSNQLCEWKFIPARTPWQGGMWERMISLTKMAIKKVLGNTMINLEELQTLIVEIESSLNDRPITFSSDDVDDLNALSPSQLIYGHKLGGLPDPVQEADPDFIDASQLNSRQKIYTRLKNHFWSRWHKEYLLALRERSANYKQASDQMISVGDIVIIHDENSPRIAWKLGRILKLKKSDDGYIRSATLRTSTGEITRPIIKLYPLEISSQISEVKIQDKEENVATSRPKRKAAMDARRAISNIDF